MSTKEQDYLQEKITWKSGPEPLYPYRLRIDTLCHEGLASQKVMRFSRLTFRKQNMPQTV